MKREFYSSSIKNFLSTDSDWILVKLVNNSTFDVNQNQRDAWIEQIKILKKALWNKSGGIFFEYSIPRMGKRIDVVTIVADVIFIMEFKIGEKRILSHDIDQVWDYALDLANFHETSHNEKILPILISTESKSKNISINKSGHSDKVFNPIISNTVDLESVIDQVLKDSYHNSINVEMWVKGRYRPTPTIIEAARSLYLNHSVDEIVRNDASAKNLSQTTSAISKIISIAQQNSQKIICFVTGVPGSGKTLVGLNIATKQHNDKNDLHSIFLSGNGPLVSVLRESLTRDKVRQEKEKGINLKKGDALSKVKAFIQNIHHYRDAYLTDDSEPYDHVAIFDEAQRAWDHKQTENFMNRKKGIRNFEYSEPEFLISCLDRHRDWAVIVCLVGGGQEINKGEAGISAWIEAIKKTYPQWKICISKNLSNEEYGISKLIEDKNISSRLEENDDLHLSVSMRSYRAENVSLLVKQILDLDKENAKSTIKTINKNYPIILTRDLTKAKMWLKNKARGSERYGIVVSSQAERLKPYSIHVKTPMNPVNWFLQNKDDVRSSYYLEDVATEFHVQGLELDWACVAWDADFRYSKNGWINRSFRGNKWQSIKQPDRISFQKNAYRVLLTRARQGMIIVVPEGNSDDNTRKKEYYDPTYNYLREIGLEIIE